MNWEWNEEACDGTTGIAAGCGEDGTGAAAVRVRESLREDRLFNDPYAQAFVDAAPGAFPEEPSSAKDLAALGPLATLGEVFSFHAALLTQARGMPAMDQYTALWKGGLGEDAPGWLSRHGWQSQLHDRAELAASYGRPGPESSSGGFLTAVRADR